MFDDIDAEITRCALYLFDFAERYKLNVQMPADLDQYRRDNSHRTVIGGECLVQLRHHPANGGRFFEKVNVVSGICQIKGGLHAGNTATYDQNRTNYILCHCFVLLIR